MRVGLFAVICAALLSMPVQAKMYRWVDENGKVQFSDKPPVTDPKSGVSEVDSTGRVVKEPARKLSPEEIARQQEEAAKQKEIQRRDRALLQSFSKPEEVDLLRDRQIDAIKAGIQTNVLRRQSGQEKLERIDKQIANLQKRKKQIPADLDADRAVAQKEIDDIDVDTKKKNADIDAVKKRAEDDKKRLMELKAGTAR